MDHQAGGARVTRMGMLERIAGIACELDRLEEAARPLRSQMSEIDREKGRLSAERKELERRLADAKDGPHVSDHAVIRYLERHHGIDCEAIRMEMLTPMVRQAVMAGAEGVRVNGGVLKIKGNVITTYMTTKAR